MLLTRVQAMDALKELFKNVLLPPRRLLFLELQPLGALPEGRDGQRRLLYFYLEDAIKKRYVARYSYFSTCICSRCGVPTALCVSLP